MVGALFCLVTTGGTGIWRVHKQRSANETSAQKARDTVARFLPSLVLLVRSEEMPALRNDAPVGVGFFVSTDGILVTSAEVLRALQTTTPRVVSVTFPAPTPLRATCIAMDSTHGIAILQLSPPTHPTAPLYLSTLESPGGIPRALGFAANSRILPQRAAIAPPSEPNETRMFWFLSVATLGSPVLLEESDEVIGVVVQPDPRAGRSGLIPMNELQEVLGRSRDHSAPPCS